MPRSPKHSTRPRNSVRQFKRVVGLPISQKQTPKGRRQRKEDQWAVSSAVNWPSRRNSRQREATFEHYLQLHGSDSEDLCPIHHWTLHPESSESALVNESLKTFD